MKLLPLFLLNSMVVLLAILLYDALREEGPAAAPPPDPNAALRARVESLEARLGALESSRSAPLPRATDAGLVERVGDLERRIQDAAPDAPPPEAGAAGPVPTSGGEPSPEDIEKFRKLATAARQAERARQIGILVDRNLAELGISLTADQRTKLIAEFDAFEPRRAEIWEQAKARGTAAGAAVNWEGIIGETDRLIAREFADAISAFLPYGDATALSASLNARGK